MSDFKFFWGGEKFDLQTWLGFGCYSQGGGIGIIPRGKKKEKNLAGCSRFCAWLGLVFPQAPLLLCLGSGQVELLRWHLLPEQAWNSSWWEGREVWGSAASKGSSPMLLIFLAIPWFFFIPCRQGALWGAQESPEHCPWEVLLLARQPLPRWVPQIPAQPSVIPIFFSPFPLLFLSSHSPFPCGNGEIQQESK